MQSLALSKRYKEEKKAEKERQKKEKVIQKQKEKSQSVSSGKGKSASKLVGSGKSTKPKNKPKKTNTKKLKAILLDLVLIYGKIKHTTKNGIGACCTCGNMGLWVLMQGGHFIPQSKGLSTKFELDNVNLQCAGCNGKANQGEQYKHGLYIDRMYGEGKAELLRIQAQKPRQWKVWELEEAIEDVENRIVSLCKKHGMARTALVVGYIVKNSSRKSNCKSLLAKITDA